MIKKNLLVGAFSNYGWDEVKVWAKSAVAHVNRDYTTLAAITYNAKEDAILNLKELGFDVFQSELPNGEYVHNKRFSDLNTLLTQVYTIETHHKILFTDVRDVVFQSNPFDKISPYDGAVCFSENILFRKEPWAIQNLSLNFPIQWEDGKVFLEQSTINVGVLCGNILGLKRLSMLLSGIIATRDTRFEMYGDQAALAIAAYYIGYKELRVKDGKDTCIHLGTTSISGIQHYPNIQNPYIIIKLNGTVNFRYDRVAIVHQYDRVPVLKEHFNNLYQ